MVNWDVVGDNMRIARERVRATWTKTFAKGRELAPQSAATKNGPDCGPVPWSTGDDA